MVSLTGPLCTCESVSRRIFVVRSNESMRAPEGIWSRADHGCSPTPRGPNGFSSERLSTIIRPGRERPGLLVVARSRVSVCGKRGGVQNEGARSGQTKNHSKAILPACHCTRSAALSAKTPKYLVGSDATPAVPAELFTELEPVPLRSHGPSADIGVASGNSARSVYPDSRIRYGTVRPFSVAKLDMW